ncbi:MAG: WD40 repeat protein [Verrucomicrobiales bacterium]|jgi:WD40 repeat protein
MRGRANRLIPILGMIWCASALGQDETHPLNRERHFDGSRASIDLEMSPDGALLVTSDTIGSVLWSVADATPIQEISEVGKIVFSPDGSHFLLVGKGIGKWSLEGKVLAYFGEDEPMVTALSYGQDGKQLVTGHDNGEILLWEMPVGILQDRWLAHSFEEVVGLVGTTDMQSLFITNGREIKEWRIPQGSFVRALESVSSITDLDISPNGHTLAASRSGGASLWEIESGKPLWNRNFGALFKPINPQTADFSTDGSYLLIGRTLWSSDGEWLRAYGCSFVGAWPPLSGRGRQSRINC